MSSTEKHRPPNKNVLSSGTGQEEREKEAGDSQGFLSLPPSRPTPPSPTSRPSPLCFIRCPPPPPPVPLPPCQTQQFQHQATQSSCRHCPPSTRPFCPAASTAPHRLPQSSRAAQRKQAGLRPHKSSTSPTDFHHFHMLSSIRDRRFLL